MKTREISNQNEVLNDYRKNSLDIVQQFHFSLDNSNQINKLLNLLFKMKFKITLMLKLEWQMANYLEPGIMCILQCIQAITNHLQYREEIRSIIAFYNDRLTLEIKVKLFGSQYFLHITLRTRTCKTLESSNCYRMNKTTR